LPIAPFRKRPETIKGGEYAWQFLGPKFSRFDPQTGCRKVRDVKKDLKSDFQVVFDAFLTPLTSMHYSAKKTVRKSCGPHGLTLGLAETNYIRKRE